MNDGKNPFTDFFANLRKWTPGIALAILTIGLMIFFKSEKGGIGTIIEEGKGHLASLFGNSMKPLVSEIPISNEDVFNFALYRNLPLSKKREKVLRIDADESGRHFFEVVPAKYREVTSNYQKFIDYLQLDQIEIDSLNSILDSYRLSIYASILVKDDNTMAIDPNIINLQGSLLTDIASFARSIDKVKSNNFIPVSASFEETNEIAKLRENVKYSKPSEYVFYSPDTVFNVRVEVDKGKMLTDIRDVERTGRSWDVKDISNFVISTGNESHPGWQDDDSSFNYEIEDNKIKIYPSKFYEKEVIQPELRELSDEVNRKAMEVTTEIIDLAKVTGEISVLLKLQNMSDSFDFDLGDQINFEFNLEDFEQSLEKNLEELEEKNWEEFGKKMEAMAISFALQFEDSIKENETAQLKLRMKELKKQLDEMNQEMSKIRKLSKPKRR